MIELLIAIRAAILADPIFAYVNDRVYITLEAEGVVFFPSSYRCPCITLTDGGEEIEWFSDENKDSRLSVSISSYMYIREPESSIIGQGDQKGVLEMSQDLQTLLVHNMLGLEGYDIAVVRTVSRTVPFFVDSQGDLAVKQNMIIEYRKDG